MQPYEDRMAKYLGSPMYKDVMLYLREGEEKATEAARPHPLRLQQFVPKEVKPGAGAPDSAIETPIKPGMILVNEPIQDGVAYGSNGTAPGIKGVIDELRRTNNMVTSKDKKRKTDESLSAVEIAADYIDLESLWL